MGYRSCVAYKIVFHDKVDGEATDPKGRAWRDLFFTFLAEAKTKSETALCFDDEGFEVLEDQLTIRFFVENIKWYDGYPDVACHIALVDLAKEYSDSFAQEITVTKLDEAQYEKSSYNITKYPLSGVFVRVGENLDDNEEDTFGEHDYGSVYITRVIRKDWGDC